MLAKLIRDRYRMKLREAERRREAGRLLAAPERVLPSEAPAGKRVLDVLCEGARHD